MSLRDKKILIGGCGLSFSRQTSKTWVNLWRASGANLVDVSGPAVSNDYILNQTIFELFKNNYDIVIIQLSFLGKLDVDISDTERHAELVLQDPVRNFTLKNIWPSSNSNHHIAKKLYNYYLQSDSIELDNINAKLLLLDRYCKNKNINLYIFLGYPINGEVSFVNTQSLTELFAPDANGLTPNIMSQFEIAKHISKIAYPELFKSIKLLEESYEQHRL